VNEFKIKNRLGPILISGPRQARTVDPRNEISLASLPPWSYSGKSDPKEHPTDLFCMDPDVSFNS